jgi:hypothetical protein
MQQKYGKYLAHPVAEIFPLLPDDRLQELAEDIKANGLNDSIVVKGNVILDGRNRYLALEKAKVKLSPSHFKKWWGTDDEIVNYIISANLHRRHLDASQRAIVADKLSEALAAEAAERQAAGRKKGGGDRRSKKAKETAAARKKAPAKKSKSSEGRANRQAAKMLNVSHSTVAKAKKVREKSPELAERVQSGEMSVHKAYEEVQEATQTAEQKETKAQEALKTKTIAAFFTLTSLRETIDKFPHSKDNEDLANLVIEACEETLTCVKSWRESNVDNNKEAAQ